MIQIDEEVALWLKDGLPDRLVWGSRRFRVSDTPTRLVAPLPELFLDAGMLTHPPRALEGWRFQATASAADCGADGADAAGQRDSRIFDVVYDARRATWLLLRAYD